MTVHEDISQALGGLRCKINPGARTHSAAVYFKQKLVLFGGRTGEDELKNDAWYRDDRTPTAFISSGPSSYTSGRYDNNIPLVKVAIVVVVKLFLFASARKMFVRRWTSRGNRGITDYYCTRFILCISMSWLPTPLL